MKEKNKTLDEFSRLLDILDELRLKCPWDMKQTNESLRKFTIEETYELAEAISSGNAPKLPVSNQVLDNIVYVIKGNNKMGVSLEHDILGKLNINLSMEKGMLNVHINASEKTAREFIENNIQYIVDSLAKDGLSVGGFSVGLKNHNDHERNVFMMSNRQESGEQQVINEKAKISSINGLVSVFA